MNAQANTLRAIILAAASLATYSAFGQPAPARSAELCESLRQSATEHGKDFITQRPGACTMKLDEGYYFTVEYDVSSLALGFGVIAGLGDRESLLLRLSAFDNLSHVALGTKPQSVFDEATRLAGKFNNNMKRGQRFKGKAQKAKVALKVAESDPFINIVVHADIKDIDKMKQNRDKAASGDIPTWRKILGASLMAFSAGAKGYTEAYNESQRNQQQQTPSRNSAQTCYTNFIGDTVVTNCY